MAARGENLLMQQKLAASRDKMNLQRVIFSRAVRARAVDRRACFMNWAMAVQKDLRYQADELARARVQEAQNRIDNLTSELCE